jgi:hypothetical protein
MENVKIIQLPSSSKIRIESELSSGRELQIMMTDMKGVQVYRGNMHESPFEFDPGALPAGAYIINLTGDGKKMSHKLVRGK